VRSKARLWWSLYAACAVAVVVALGWISRIALDLELSEAKARVEVGHEQFVQEALWRMDSWLAPILAAEGARAVEEYTPIRYAGGLGAFATSELLEFRSRHIRQHFEIVEGGTLMSPQAPQGEDRDRAIDLGVAAATCDLNFVNLTAVEPLIDFDALSSRVKELEDRMAAVVREQLSPGLLNVSQNAEQFVQNDSWVATKNALEGSNRARQARKKAGFNAAPRGQYPQQLKRARVVGEPLRVGPLVAVWLGEVGLQELAFVRRVTVPIDRSLWDADTRERKEALQGFLVDWDALEADLLDQVADLFPGASLKPVEEERTVDDATGRALATVPVTIAVPPPPAPLLVGGPTRTALWLTWGAVLCALAVAGVTLRAAIAYGDRRSRFASAVTHELRTPLTTFRIYTEMLADGMVEDPDTRQDYLRTLHGESERLTSVVENVLAYSRLEQGRAIGRVERVSIRDLVDRLQARLERRAADADVQLSIDVRGPGTDTVSADVEAVGQILVNLVDNACKYGRSSETPRIEITIDAPPGRVCFSVRDHGPGVAAAHRKSIFESFERGGRDDGSIPGVGLGLALSRGLARELGGDVTLARDQDAGARFLLDLPS